MKFVFSSFPEFSDNSLMILQELMKAQVPGKIYWLISKDAKMKNLMEKARFYFPKNFTRVHFVRKNTFIGIFHYLTANYIFETHGMFEQFPIFPWQTKVNLWHGMPLKRIGRLSGNPVRLKMSYSLSTAPIFDKIIAQAFEISESQIIKLGLPRNDLFFRTTRFNFKQLFSNELPTIAWLPTYRQSDVGDIRVDGEQRVDSIGGFTLDQIYQLDQVLQTDQLNLLIKLHPMDVLNERISELPDFKSIRIVNVEQFQSLSVEVTEFLQASVALITDYSSVYFDYLLTQRPIGITSLDESAYSQTRGFVSNEVVNHFKGFSITDLSTFKRFVDGVANGTLSLNTDNIRFFNEYDRHGSNSAVLLEILGITVSKNDEGRE